MLHVTNGDIAAELIRDACLPGETLPWRDVLHEGPVPSGLDDAALRRVRAEFIAASGWAPFEQVLADFEQRDQTLARALADGDEILLWFEHDLYDQLQLIQLLDRFSGHDRKTLRVELICIGEHPEIPRFCGLGQLSPAQMAALLPARRPVGARELELGRIAWAAFRSRDPSHLQALVDGDLSALPFLAGALVRHLEQLPSLRGGLARTERQILTQLAAAPDHPRSPSALFVAAAEDEERCYMGDSTFLLYLRGLARGPRPLITLPPDLTQLVPGDPACAQITADGLAVLAGELDWPALVPLDRWLGGVHLQGATPPWRWDADRRRLAVLD
jgi:hypothetical protein